MRAPRLSTPRRSSTLMAHGPGSSVSSAIVPVDEVTPTMRLGALAVDGDRSRVGRQPCDRSARPSERARGRKRHHRERRRRSRRRPVARRERGSQPGLIGDERLRREEDAAADAARPLAGDELHLRVVFLQQEGPVAWPSSPRGRRRSSAPVSKSRSPPTTRRACRRPARSGSSASRAATRGSRPMPRSSSGPDRYGAPRRHRAR